MTVPFDFPSSSHGRRHGPIGYADYSSYRPWLRDEFSFRCVYCLLREQWGRVGGIFDIEHYQAIINRPEREADYDNLLYACATCNSAKQSMDIPDPLIVLTEQTVYVAEDGRIHATTADAACLIEILGLNSEEAIEFRMTWIGIIALAAKRDAGLYVRLMGFPQDLPDLQKRKPPGGNRRPAGIAASYNELRKRGELPETY